ncbi:MAG: hypothetical protein AAF497_08145 [Planctomycetota bacterium]
MVNIDTNPPFDPRFTDLLPARASTGRMIAIAGCDNNRGFSGSLLGQRLIDWPHGIYDRRVYAIVSSRLGRKLEEQREWFSALRAIVAKVANDSGVLLTVEGTAAHPFVARAAELFGADWISLQLPGDESIESWWQERVVESSSNDAGKAWLSPEFAESQENETKSSIPLRDRALMALADEVVALQVRKNGNVDQLIRQRAQWAKTQTADPGTRVVMAERLTKKGLANELLGLGAVGWIPYSTTEERIRSNPVIHKSERAFRLPTDLSDSYLTHCTRRRTGPWPGQTPSEFANDLFLNRQDADHSPFAALKRIVNSRRLVASSEAIRGGAKVVCFTGVPLEELEQLRVFRSHRGRWDFEPYGVCIRKSALEMLGAAPVVYGDKDTWNGLEESQKPFFQKRESVSKSGEAMDWTLEQEWRYVGDVMLDQFEPTDVMVFVPSVSEARKLSAICPWRVVVV